MDRNFQINCLADLLQWANDCNQGITLKKKCDAQDIYARMNQAYVTNLFLDMALTPNERRSILNAVYNTMAYEEVERLLLAWAKDRAMKKLQELDEEEDVQRAERERGWKDYMDKERARIEERYRKVTDAQIIFNECRAKIEKRIRWFKQNCDGLRAQMVHYRTLAERNGDAANRYKDQLQKFKSDALKLATIKKALGIKEEEE